MGQGRDGKSYAQIRRSKGRKSYISLPVLLVRSEFWFEGVAIRGDPACNLSVLGLSGGTNLGHLGSKVFPGSMEAAQACQQTLYKELTLPPAI
nr:hypothetical protein BdHM001_36400 [Bdellovibrio sp. HM001]